MARFKAMFNERAAMAMSVSMKTSSGATRISAMPPFDWTRNKAIYQRWQTWSKKPRHTLEAMEGDSEKAKISYFHHWIDSTGEAQIESLINNGTLLKQGDDDILSQDEKKGKYSLNNIVSYFILFELLLAPKSNLLLAVEELYTIKQGSMTSGEFHAHITKVVKRCNFPNKEAEERAIRDMLFLEMNSTKARDKAINLMNEEGKELTVDFLMTHLEVEDYHTHHKNLSQLDSIASDHRQNKQGRNNKNLTNGRPQV